ncbi:hypothetical protein L596_007998 [Steinernema carpocapsae]|uniref:Uncharacterized protein n=1 Tax=Steinernema carpocapsae TaxID=34508 RepID=A0A4U5PBM7_STECR|nr:hypothetical protein L596_007998 [Steinernema carpocapsae]
MTAPIASMQVLTCDFFTIVLSSVALQGVRFVVTRGPPLQIGVAKTRSCQLPEGDRIFRPVVESAQSREVFVNVAARFLRSAEMTEAEKAESSDGELEGD